MKNIIFLLLILLSLGVGAFDTNYCKAIYGDDYYSSSEHCCPIDTVYDTSINQCVMNVCSPCISDPDNYEIKYYTDPDGIKEGHCCPKNTIWVEGNQKCSADGNSGNVYQTGLLLNEEDYSKIHGIYYDVDLVLNGGNCRDNPANTFNGFKNYLSTIKGPSYTIDLTDPENEAIIDDYINTVQLSCTRKPAQSESNPNFDKTVDPANCPNFPYCNPECEAVAISNFDIRCACLFREKHNQLWDSLSHRKCTTAFGIYGINDMYEPNNQNQKNIVKNYYATNCNVEPIIVTKKIEDPPYKDNKMPWECTVLLPTTQAIPNSDVKEYYLKQCDTKLNRIIPYYNKNDFPHILETPVLSASLSSTSTKKCIYEEDDETDDETTDEGDVIHHTTTIINHINTNVVGITKPSSPTINSAANAITGMVVAPSCPIADQGTVNAGCWSPDNSGYPPDVNMESDNSHSCESPDKTCYKCKTDYNWDGTQCIFAKPGGYCPKNTRKTISTTNPYAYFHDYLGCFENKEISHSEKDTSYLCDATCTNNNCGCYRCKQGYAFVGNRCVEIESKDPCPTETTEGYDYIGCVQDKVNNGEPDLNYLCSISKRCYRCKQGYAWDGKECAKDIGRELNCDAKIINVNGKAFSYAGCLDKKPSNAERDRENFKCANEEQHCYRCKIGFTWGNINSKCSDDTIQQTDWIKQKLRQFKFQDGKIISINTLPPSQNQLGICCLVPDACVFDSGNGPTCYGPGDQLTDINNGDINGDGIPEMCLPYTRLPCEPQQNTKKAGCFKVGDNPQNSYQNDNFGICSEGMCTICNDGYEWDGVNTCASKCATGLELVNGECVAK